MSTNVTKSFNIPASAVVPVYGYAINGFTATAVGQLSILIDGVSTIVPINTLGYSAFNINLGSSNQITSINGVAGSLVCTEPVSPVISGGGNSGSDLSSSILSMGLGAQNINYSNTQKIRSAMARTDRNAIVACIGPSTTRGISTGGGTTQFPNAWPIQLAALLQKQGINAGANNSFGDGGTGSQSGLAAADSRSVFTGAFAQAGIATLGGLALTASATGTWTFTPTANVTKYDIYWRDNGTGRTFSWAIDGGAATNVASSGATTMQKTTVSAGTAGLRALTTAWVAGAITIIGVSGYDDTAGRREITFLNWGISGARSDQFLTDIDTAGVGRVTAWKAIAPDLTILDDWPINDWRQSTSIAAYQANLQVGIDTARASGDVVMTTPLWDAQTTGNGLMQDAYVAAGVQVALANSVPILDVRAAWVSYTAAQGLGWYSTGPDAVHPSILGYAVKSAALSEFFRRLKAM